MTRTKRTHTISVLVAFAALASGGARASVIFTRGNHPQQPGEQNILFGSAQTGISISGTTNQSGTPVLFTSSQSLSTGGTGQAFLQPTGSTALLTDFTFSVPGSTFTDFIFNPMIAGQPKGGGGTATVTAVANDGSSTFSYDLGAERRPRAPLAVPENQGCGRGWPGPAAAGRERNPSAITLDPAELPVAVMLLGPGRGGFARPTTRRVRLEVRWWRRDALKPARPFDAVIGLGDGLAVTKIAFWMRT